MAFLELIPPLGIGGRAVAVEVAGGKDSGGKITAAPPNQIPTPLHPPDQKIIQRSRGEEVTDGRASELFFGSFSLVMGGKDLDSLAPIRLGQNLNPVALTRATGELAVRVNAPILRYLKGR